MATLAVDFMPYSGLIDGAARSSWNRVRDSVLGHNESVEELCALWRDCKHAGWDGYDATPIDRDAFLAASRLIQSLPLGFPRPSLGAEPDGQVTLEWRSSPNRTLSVSVDPNGYLHYAGLYGTSKRYGTLTFYAQAPDELIQLVRDV